MKIDPRIVRWKLWARSLKQEVRALYFAMGHPSTPWYAKVAAGCIVAYALSPIDLIPDSIPIFGYLDDLIIVPLSIKLVRRLIPPDVIAECRERAHEHVPEATSMRWLGLAIVLAIWTAMLGLLTILLVHVLAK